MVLRASMLFRRSNVAQYKDRAPGIAGLLRTDSPALRIVLFIAMSAVFFLFLKISSRKIPHGLAVDSTEDSVAAVHQPK